MSNVIRKAQKTKEKKTKNRVKVSRIVGLCTAIACPVVTAFVLIANPTISVKVNNFVRGKEYYSIYVEDERKLVKPVTYDIESVVSILDDYNLKDLQLSGENVFKITDVDDLIDEDLANYSVSEEMPIGSEVYEGVTVNINFVGKLNGEPFEGGSAEGSELVLGEGSFIEDFETGIVGHTVGESFTIEATFPEDYGVELLDGQTATFDITINSAKYEQAFTHNTVTDEFISTNFDYANYEEYYQAKSEELQQTVESNLETEKEYLVMEALQSATKVKIPEDLMEQELSIYQQQFTHMYVDEGMTLTAYLSENYEMSIKDFRDEVSSDVETSLRNTLICERFAKLLGIELTDEDFTAYAETLMEGSTYRTLEDIIPLYTTDYLGGEEYLRRMALADKVIKELMKEATFV